MKKKKGVLCNLNSLNSEITLHFLHDIFHFMASLTFNGQCSSLTPGGSSTWIIFLLRTNSWVYALQIFIYLSVYLSVCLSNYLFLLIRTIGEEHGQKLFLIRQHYLEEPELCPVVWAGSQGTLGCRTGWGWQEWLREWLHFFAHSRSVSDLALLFPSASSFNLSSWLSSQHSFCPSQKTTIHLRRLLKKNVIFKFVFSLVICFSFQESC